jgi:dTDP-4-amino-4,6-dideoxygalactose transaminase
MMIPFNKPFLTGKELSYIQEAVSSGKISGDGMFTKKCHEFFQDKFGFRKCLLTTSCTDALEMAAILLDIEPGDEVILPSYTFVSSANAFVLRGAKIIFADSNSLNPNVDVNSLEPLINRRTKAIVVVHYAGIACDMKAVMELADKYHLAVVEDAAQAIDSYFEGRPLGSIGHLATFSFHETKNIQCGEGGMLVVNDDRFAMRAEVIREKGTNRSAFFKGQVDKYGWVDIGSSFLPSEIIAAFLFAQLENLDLIQGRRKELWNNYYNEFSQLDTKESPGLPSIPSYATNNAHLFYILCKDESERDQLIAEFKRNNILAVFHYLPLHKSPYYHFRHDGRNLPHCDRYSEVLLRLPLFYELTDDEQQAVIEVVKRFYQKLPEPRTRYVSETLIR